MAASDARPIPIKNTAFRVVFPILDADGDLVTGATGLDSEVSKDQGTFADCTNEATEIATSSGMYYLDLTSTEMNADCVAVIVKTTSSGAKTTTIVLYPEETGDINVDVTAYGGTAGTFSGGRPETNVSHWKGSTAPAMTGDAYARLGAPAGASIAADILAIDNFVDDIESRLGTPSDLGSGATIAANLVDIEGQTDSIPTDVWAAGTRTLTALDEDSTTIDLDAAIRAALGLAAANLDTQLGDLPTVTDILTTAMTESYNADGAAPTLAQALFGILQVLTEASVSGTTMTVKKLDGSTAAFTLTLDSATSPTSITRAT